MWVVTILDKDRCEAEVVCLRSLSSLVQKNGGPASKAPALLLTCLSTTYLISLGVVCTLRSTIVLQTLQSHPDPLSLDSQIVPGQADASCTQRVNVSDVRRRQLQSPKTLLLTPIVVLPMRLRGLGSVHNHLNR